ncbi:hypothetical protein AX14_007841, partial [Amanita brunnescens Koide BX004]
TSVARRISREAFTIREDLHEDDIIQRATAQLGFDVPVPHEMLVRPALITGA